MRVTLHADLRRHLRPGEAATHSAALPRGSTVADLLAQIGIPPSDTVTVALNGELAQPGDPLHDRDEVVMFSQMEGG